MRPVRYEPTRGTSLRQCSTCSRHVGGYRGVSHGTSNSSGGDMIRLGIVGCGWVAEAVHIPVLQRLQGIVVHAVCDTRDERLRHMQQAFGIARCYRAWQELVSDAEIDAVLVATPGDQHAPIAHGVLAAGKHVLVEKPLCLTLAEAHALAAAASASAAVAMVGLNYRFHPLVQRLRDAITHGDLGRPLAAFFTLTTMRDQR